MARMRLEYFNYFARFTTFLKAALPNVAADAAKFSAFVRWSGLASEQARDALQLGTTSPWIDIGDAGIASNQSAARGRYDPDLGNRITIAEDIALYFEQTADDPALNELVEATVVHELVHWGYASIGNQEGEDEERGLSYETEVYRGARTRFGALVNGRFPVASPAPVLMTNRIEPVPLLGRPASAPTGILRDQTIKAIVNVFETGYVLGDYSRVTLVPGDLGGLTYGRSQITLNSGGLHDVVVNYVSALGSRWATQLQPFVPQLGAQDSTLTSNIYFLNLLRATVDDPIMRQTQDAFFDERYWTPALAATARSGISTALGIAVVYDSTVHGSWADLRRKTDNNHGAVAAIGEAAWIEAYVGERRSWLANHRLQRLHATVYRMDAFLALIRGGAWDLELPLMVRNQEINLHTLADIPTRVYTDPTLGSRNIALTTPVTRGLDVRLVQLTLSYKPHVQHVVADGIYGRQTAQVVQRVQQALGLPMTGIFGDSEFHAMGNTFAALGIALAI